MTDPALIVRARRLRAARSAWVGPLDAGVSAVELPLELDGEDLEAGFGAPLPRHEPPVHGHEAPLTGQETAAGAHGSPDAELAEILPGITGPSGQFRHRQHINLAFVAVRRYGMPEATARICGWIQRIAAYERAPQKYHHTVSRAWVEIVAHHVDADPDCADFDTFAKRNPALLDKAGPR